MSDKTSEEEPVKFTVLGTISKRSCWLRVTVGDMTVFEVEHPSSLRAFIKAEEALARRTVGL